MKIFVFILSEGIRVKNINIRFILTGSDFEEVSYAHDN